MVGSAVAGEAVDAALGGGGGYSGGGSFDPGADQILVADLQTGNGGVVITELAPVFAGTTLLLGFCILASFRSIAHASPILQGTTTAPTGISGIVDGTNTYVSLPRTTAETPRRPCEAGCSKYTMVRFSNLVSNRLPEH